MYRLVCLSVLVALASAKGLPYKDCAHHEVTDFEITGCTTNPCTLHKGSNITISVEFVANQDSPTAVLELIAQIGSVTYPIPLPDKDGCHFMKCPLKKGETAKLVYPGTIPTAAPTVEADVTAKLIGVEGDLVCGTVHGDIKD